MRKIFYELEVGFAGCGDEGVMEVPDDMSDDEISIMVDDMAQDWAMSWEGDTRLGWDEDMDEEEFAEETQNFYANASGSWRDATEDDE